MFNISNSVFYFISSEPCLILSSKFNNHLSEGKERPLVGKTAHYSPVYRPALPERLLHTTRSIFGLQLTITLFIEY